MKLIQIAFATIIALSSGTAIARDNPTVAPPSAGAYGPMSSADRNKDGTVTWAEWQDFLRDGPYRRYGFLIYFDMLDVNSDGNLDASERAKAEPQDTYNDVDFNEYTDIYIERGEYEGVEDVTNEILPHVDWENIVSMYLTGRGTRTGVPLRDIKRGDTLEDTTCDRKLLEKRRTIGRAYEKLEKIAKGLFGKTIGYTRFGTKARMYQVVKKCRAVNQLVKQGIQLPDNSEQLEQLIAERIEARKNKLSIKYICNTRTNKYKHV